MTVMTSLTSKMGLSLLPPPCVRLPQSAFAPTLNRRTTADQALLCWPPRTTDLKPCDLFSIGVMIKTLSFCCLYHRIRLNCEDELMLPSEPGENALSPWRPLCALTGCAKNGRVSLSICRLLSAIQVQQFYKMCQGFMNNPARHVSWIPVF